MTPVKVTDAAALAEKAERLRAQAAEADAGCRRRAAEMADRQNARQAAWDERFVAAWDPKALEAEVERTAAELEQAIAEDPVVVALTAYYHAQSRRRWLTAELFGALDRLGRPTAGAQLPPTATPPSAEALVGGVVERRSADMGAAERADMERQRNGEDDA